MDGEKGWTERRGSFLHHLEERHLHDGIDAHILEWFALVGYIHRYTKQRELTKLREPLYFSG
jgi:hypothetical protein